MTIVSNFAELIAHLNMSGLNIELDYEKIQSSSQHNRKNPNLLQIALRKYQIISRNSFSRQYGTTAKKFLYEF